ncbi:Trifunctional nucleotide phosphoesterase protein YfkN precursor [Metamycoplasma arthritidis]|uniref:5' nucleosidase, lipoprotein n=1 Tax=Metamycoplasma arthritidis (strain 158L3-1) TaxID=243272 RepID=B3PMG3_META1|nr:bifunctional UDP-sugar hydrolase/5'-nucleotidase [Metamycoplasma arthritidis]ACF07215.1 5' nucleosidase, lipoprotein [Metamycoplasma arthritidis 158L3-1]VEU78739.1 Trifunctional nucleotide phosphoesterase protein YfkN precursor [Metamycoplasma arthritidis]
MKHWKKLLLSGSILIPTVFVPAIVASSCDNKKTSENKELDKQKNLYLSKLDELKSVKNGQIKDVITSKISPLIDEYYSRVSKASSLEELANLKNEMLEKVDKEFEEKLEIIRKEYLDTISKNVETITKYGLELKAIKEKINKEKDKTKKAELTKQRVEYVNSKKSEVTEMTSKIKASYQELRVLELLSDKQTIRMFHTNDEHGRILADDGRYNNYSGMTGTAEFYKRRMAELILSAGDLIQGLPMNDSDKGWTISRMAQKMGYQAVAVGNHEFDFGLKHIKEIDKETSAKGMPFLSSNIVWKQGHKIDGKDVSDQHVFKPYIIKQLSNGMKVAVLGITTPDTQWTSHPNNSKDVNFQDPTEAAKRVVAEIKEKHKDVNLIMAITHLGVGRSNVKWNSDYVAQQVPDIDLFIDGHSHTKVDVHKIANNPVNYNTQTEAYTKYVGDMNFVFSKKEGIIKSMQQKLWDINEIEILNSGLHDTSSKLSPEYRELVEPLERKFEKIKNEELFTSAFSFKHVDTVNINGTPYWRGRVQPTNLGIFASDALAWRFTNSIKPERAGSLSMDNVIGLMNGGGLRSDLEAKTITRGDMLSLAPFGNRIAAVGIKGKQLKAMFAHGVASVGSGAFGQYSHNVSMDIEYEDVEAENNPGKKVRKYTIKEGTLKINGKEIQDDQEYFVVSNDYIFTGGDRYTMLKKGSEGVRDIYEGEDLIESLVAYGKYLNSTSKDEIEKSPFAKVMEEYGKKDGENWTITSGIKISPKN